MQYYYFPTLPTGTPTVLAGPERFFLPAEDERGAPASVAARAHTLQTEGLAAERKSSVIGVGRPQLHSAGAADADTESRYGGRWVAAPVAPAPPASATPRTAWPQLPSHPAAPPPESPHDSHEPPPKQRGAHPVDSLGAGVAEAGPPLPWRRLRRAAAGTAGAEETSRILLGGDPLPAALPVAFVAERRGFGAAGAGSSGAAAQGSGQRGATEHLGGGGGRGGGAVSARQALRSRIEAADRRAVLDLPALQ